MSKKITVQVDTGKTLPLDYLKPLQGELKELSDDSRKKLKNSILKNGFCFPMFVWEDNGSGDIYLIDGHQRWKVLNELREKKYSIPQLPVVMIPANDIDEAKSKLAAAASTFGEFTEHGVKKFFESFKVDTSLFETIKMPHLDFKIPETTTAQEHERNFSPGDEDDQGRLDKKTLTKCPLCNHIFDHAENKNADE